MCEDGSTGITATRLFFLMSFIPKFSINVDFPAPVEKMQFFSAKSDHDIMMRGGSCADDYMNPIA